jgi:hypothetical protein
MLDVRYEILEFVCKSEQSAIGRSEESIIELHQYYKELQIRSFDFATSGFAQDDI